MFISWSPGFSPFTGLFSVHQLGAYPDPSLPRRPIPRLYCPDPAWAGTVSRLEGSRYTRYKYKLIHEEQGACRGSLKQLQ